MDCNTSHSGNVTKSICELCHFACVHNAELDVFIMETWSDENDSECFSTGTIVTNG